MPQRSRFQRAFYDFLHVACRLFGAAVLHVRVRGRQHLPGHGAALLLANHQSYLDPVLVGLAADRRLSFVARDSLFRNLLFAALIRTLHAIPLDRDGQGISGIKETLRRLKQGEVVLLFPEGTRTPDGRVQRLRSGFSVLARRAGVPLVPVGIAGAFQMWPRRAKFPGLGTIHIEFGPPVTAAEAASFSDELLVREVERRIVACQAAAERHRAAALGDSLGGPRRAPYTTGQSAEPPGRRR